MEETFTKQSKRYRISIPPKDASVISWMDEQFNLSESLRILIKEHIERNGVIDVACEPVEQLPKRGRPPVTVDKSEPSDKSSTNKSKVDSKVVKDSVELVDDNQVVTDPSEADDIFSAMRIGR